MALWSNIVPVVRPISRKSTRIGRILQKHFLAEELKGIKGHYNCLVLHKSVKKYSTMTKISRHYLCNVTQYKPPIIRINRSNNFLEQKKALLFLSKSYNYSTVVNSNSVREKVALLRSKSTLKLDRRFLSCQGDGGEMLGLVLGVFTRKDDPYGTTRIYTKFAGEFDNLVGNKISDILDNTGPIPKKGQYKIFYRIDPTFTSVIIVGIGDECATFNNFEVMDEMKENVRDAAALGVRTLQELNMKTVFVEGMGSTEAAAEGAAMGVWRFQELKNPVKQMLIPRIELHGDCDYTAWQIGLQKAAAQNVARQLCETPANILNPLGLAQSAVEILCKTGVSVEVKVRDWAKIMKMEGFLSAARGSCEQPIFLEMSYYGCDPDVSPIVLVGKGVTFDSGGLCLKTCQRLEPMRGDMAGGANLIGTIRAASALHLPINIRGLIPIYENLPGSCALKPGDTIKVRNGKTVLIHNTDYDGRLSIADALCYSQIYNPKFILDIGSFSHELNDSIGPGATAVFSNNESLFETMQNAAVHTGDRIWRMPLWEHFTHKVTSNPSSDVEDMKVRSGAPCSCAAFLREFVPPVDWLHCDTFSVTLSDGNTEFYLRKGMSGRPTRTLVEFLAQLACQTDDEEK